MAVRTPLALNALLALCLCMLTYLGSVHYPQRAAHVFSEIPRRVLGDRALLCRLDSNQACLTLAVAKP
jgi:hypothetical protein